MINNMFHKIMSKACELRLRKLKLQEGNTVQAAFRKGKSCADHLFLFRTIVEAMKLRKRTLHVCYVDFSKAFDSIPRAKLWDNLDSIGVPCGLVRTIQILHQNATVKIQVEGELTDKFGSNAGVRQGCPLSPLLFCLYIQDLQTRLDSSRDAHPVQLLKLQTISCLMFADDVVIFSTRKTGMQKQLNELWEYCREKHLHVNMEKTQMMSFACRAVGTDTWKPFKYGEMDVEQTSRYVYLGLQVNVKHTFTAMVKDNASRTSTASWALAAALTEKNMTSTRAVWRVWDACILSKMNYGVEAWGPACSKSQWEEVEKIQAGYAKFHLGVRQSVCTANILAELGRYPMEISALISVTRYIKRIMKLDEKHLARQALDLAQQTEREFQKGWMADLREWARKWKINSSWLFDMRDDTIRRAYLDCKWSWEELSTDQRFYTENMSQGLKYERREYLNESMQPKFRASLARFRLRGHQLGIIRRRWSGMDEDGIAQDVTQHMTMTNSICCFNVWP